MTRFFGSVCQDLGIPYAGDGVIPETGDIPRVFLLVADEDGNERPVSLQEAGISVESPEFWTQAYMGNVLMYPAGQKDPVQFLPDINDKGKMEYSKPITKDSIPPKAMEQPGGFARFMHWISGGRLFKNVDKYRTLQEKAALGKHFDQWQREQRCHYFACWQW